MEEDEKMFAESRVIKILSELSDTAGSLNFGLDLNSLLENFLERMLDITGVEAITLFMIDGRILTPKTIVGEQKENLSRLLIGKRIFIGQGIVGWAADMNKPVIVNEPYSHPRFLQQFDKDSGFISKNILCVPLITDGKIKGVIELVNKKSGDFDEIDANIIKVITSIIGITIKNEQISKESQKWKNYYEIILENIPSGFIGIGLDKKILFYNKAAELILGVMNASFVGKGYDEVLSKIPGILKILTSMLITKSSVNRQEAELLLPTGQKLRLGYGTIILKDHSEKIIGYGLIFQDITAKVTA